MEVPDPVVAFDAAVGERARLKLPLCHQHEIGCKTAASRLTHTVKSCNCKKIGLVIVVMLI